MVRSIWSFLRSLSRVDDVYHACMYAQHKQQMRNIVDVRRYIHGDDDHKKTQENTMKNMNEQENQFEKRDLTLKRTRENSASAATCINFAAHIQTHRKYHLIYPLVQPLLPPFQASPPPCA